MIRYVYNYTTMKERATNPYLRTENDRQVITQEGYEALQSVVTDSTGQVYAFTKDISPVIVAAAMARLSRRSGDMRVAILDEFLVSGDAEAEALIERVVTGYGDDSVQQLIGIQFVVEGASNLLTKLLEWGRFASYLEQSTRYIYFDQKDSKGKYLYYAPTLPASLKKEYTTTLDTIFDLYSTMVRDLTTYLRTKHPEPADRKERVAWINSTRATACDAVRSVLPVATKSTVGIFASSQAVESLVTHLLSEPLKEAQDVGRLILEQARKVVPSFLKRVDMPERGGATTAFRATNRSKMRDLAHTYLDFSKAPSASMNVHLTDYWPRQELDLVPGMLFEQSEPLSYADIESQVKTWPKERKEEVFNQYMGTRLNRRHRPGRAAEKAHFEWEIDGKDYGTFRDLQRHRVVDAWEWQRLSPHFGFEIPELVVEAGFADAYSKCYALSSQLYETLAKAGFEVEAQYATLLGHRMRYRFIMNLRALFHFLELRTGPDGHPGYRKICNTMYTLLADAYPLSAQAMRFVNQREDPELTRQAAELATQFKLEKLESSQSK
jgi:thymidylate synthase ThyX